MCENEAAMFMLYNMTHLHGRMRRFNTFSKVVSTPCANDLGFDIQCIESVLLFNI